MVALSKQKPGFYGWKNVIFLFFIYMFTIGLSFYGFSVIFPVMIKTMAWNRGEASIAHTLSILMAGLLIPLVAALINKFGTKRIISVGTALMLLGLILLGTVTTQLWQWTILWGFVISAGLALGSFLAIQTTLIYWFNINRATAIGIVLTGSCIGGFIAQPFYTWLMNATQTWQVGWLTSGFFALIAFCLSFFIISKPEDIGQYVDGINPEQIDTSLEDTKKKVRTYRTDETWELKAVLRTPTLWYTAIFWIGHIMPYMLIMSHGVLHFTDIGYTKMQSASVISFIILGSGMARFPTGWIADRIEPRWIITASLWLMLFAFIALWKLPNFNSLVIAAMILGGCHGSQLITFPTLIGNYYGPDRFASINGALAPFSVGFSALVPMGSGYLFELTGNYDTAFTLLIIVLITSLIASFFLLPPTKK